MPSYTPVTTPAPGSFTGPNGVSSVVDSTYGALGAVYGAIHYVYGGFQLSFAGLSNSAGSFSHSTGSSGSFTAVPPVGGGSYTPV